MSVSGLRQRLESLEGVAGIHVELAEAGLAGIRILLTEGADEDLVLEKVRSMLVTYGLRSAGRLDDIPRIGRSPSPGARTKTLISPEGEGMRVEVRAEGKSVVRVVEATPLAAAVAVAEGQALLEGRPAPQVLWVGLDAVGEWRVLTVLVRDEIGPPKVGAAVVSSGWAEALGEAVARAR